ncbi:MAG: hypothetical protein EOO09_15610 [Chitinophagaceae bacterium]|nr:MAG: hypothetical protein EOO09_15610 [Chitinophagaceae bacterium]
MPAIKSNPARKPANRMRDMIGSSASPLFTCSLTKRPVPIRPKGRSEMDSDGHILLFVDRHVIQAEPGTHSAQLFYANGQEMEYLSVTGTGEQVTDPETIQAVLARHSAGEGVQEDDVLIRIRPVSAFSWNTRTGTLTPIMKQ